MTLVNLAVDLYADLWGLLVSLHLYLFLRTGFYWQEGMMALCLEQP